MRRWGEGGCVGGVTKTEAKRISEKPFLDSYSLEMPEKEMSYSLIGQGFLEEETGQRIIEVLLILEHLEEQERKEGERERRCKGEVQTSHLRLHDAHLQLRMRWLKTASLKCKRDVAEPTCTS